MEKVKRKKDKKIENLTWSIRRGRFSRDNRTDEVISMTLVVMKGLHLCNKKFLNIKHKYELETTFTNIVKDKGRKLMRIWTLESRILAPTCLLSHPKVL